MRKRYYLLFIPVTKSIKGKLCFTPVSVLVLFVLQLVLCFLYLIANNQAFYLKDLENRVAASEES